MITKEELNEKFASGKSKLKKNTKTEKWLTVCMVELFTIVVYLEVDNFKCNTAGFRVELVPNFITLN